MPRRRYAFTEEGIVDRDARLRKQPDRNAALRLIEPPADESLVRRDEVDHIAVLDVAQAPELVPVGPEVPAKQSTLFFRI